jgi:uncharacterized protein DUF4177
MLGIVLRELYDPGTAGRGTPDRTVIRLLAPEGHDMTARFEHKVLKFGWGWKGFDYAAMERELNELGAQGWETVGTIVPSVGAGQSIEIGVVLKRTVG